MRAALPCVHSMKCIVDMHKMDLNSIDLNLLKFLDALAQERSVTRAGLRLGLSQPAASRALGRLRAMLDDRLVARGQHGLELTPRGQQLAGPVSRLLESARAIVSPPSFDPATASGRYTLAARPPGAADRAGIDGAVRAAGAGPGPGHCPARRRQRPPGRRRRRGPGRGRVRRAARQPVQACAVRTGWPACCAPAIPTPPPWTWMATWRCATSPSPSPAWARAPWTRPCRRAA